jgi:hypothetical protein
MRAASIIEDGEVRGQPDLLRMPAQHARRKRMEGAQPQALGRLAQDGGDALAHLPRRLVGEGDGQYL